MPQVVIRGPVSVADPGDQVRLKPSAFLHHFRRQSFAPSGAFRLRKIGKRAPGRFKRLHLSLDLALQGRRKSFSDFGDEDQLLPFVVADQERIRTVAAGL